MRNQIRIFLTAIMFYTRIPVPERINHSREYLNKATGYLPLVGWLVGGFSALVFWISSFVFPGSISLLFGMVSSIWLTGAFHEDGLADFMDGIGGGWSRDRILDIMKDSRLGTYGVIGLVSVLTLKFISLLQFSEQTVPFLLVIGHSASRSMPLWLISTMEYAREEGSGRSEAAAIASLPFPILLLSTITGFLPVILLQDLKLFLLIPALLLLFALLNFYFRKNIGGYTGDCLGASQQIAEVFIYLIILLLL